MTTTICEMRQLQRADTVCFWMGRECNYPEICFDVPRAPELDDIENKMLGVELPNEGAVRVHADFLSLV